MKNPFRANVFDNIQNIVRTSLWLAAVVNCGIVALFSILFVWYFCSFTWRWMLRTLFSEEWGI